MTNSHSKPPGTRNDMASGRTLSRLHPFFGVTGSAERFVSLSLTSFLDEIPGPQEPITCFDIGGGEGVVAAAFKAMCKSKGIRCNVTVIDENPRFLKEAERCGLETYSGPLGNLKKASADCAILRFVNHYNDASTQVTMAQEIADLVKPGGVLAAQIETGDEETCRLHDQISQVFEAEPNDAVQHWATLGQFQRMYTDAGFEVVAVLGDGVVDETPIQDRLEMAWYRQYGDAFDIAIVEGNATNTISALNAREDFLHQAWAILRTANAPEVVRTMQPIIVFRRLPVGMPHAS